MINSFLVAMIYWNYYLTVATDPGRVPRSWVSFGLHFRDNRPLNPLSCLSNQMCEPTKGMKSSACLGSRDIVGRVTPTSRHVPITAVSARNACFEWTIIAHGSTTASGSTIMDTLSAFFSSSTLRVRIMPSWSPDVPSMR